MLNYESYTYKDLVIVNSTPHVIDFKDEDGFEFQVNPSCLINATPVETVVNKHLVRTRFYGNEDAERILDDIYRDFNNEYSNTDMTLIVVGSIIAAQAYPGRVFAMTPTKGYERVAPSEKRMNPEKFTTYQ